MSFHCLFAHMQKYSLKECINTYVNQKVEGGSQATSQHTNLYSQLIPPTTERAISLAPSSYTCLVSQSPRNTLSATNHNKYSEKLCSR